MKKIFKIICCCFLLFGCKPNEEPIIEEEISIIHNHVYDAPKNPSNAHKKAFNLLSEHIREQKIDKISEDVVICFVFDFFTLKNKENGLDVGGQEYLPPSRIHEFSEFALRTYYKNYDILLNKYGAEHLPEVIHVSIETKKEIEVEYLNETYEGYVFNLYVEYAQSDIPVEELKTSIQIKCLVYDKKAMVVSLKQDKLHLQFVFIFGAY